MGELRTTVRNLRIALRELSRGELAFCLLVAAGLVAYASAGPGALAILVAGISAGLLCGVAIGWSRRRRERPPTRARSTSAGRQSKPGRGGRPGA